MDANNTHYSYTDLLVRQKVAYLVLGIAIVVVNVVVMVAFALDRDIRSIPGNYFILNLSISDFITGIDSLSTFVWSVTGGVVPLQENTLCVIIGAFHYGIRLMSVLILLEISYDRLQMVSNPFEHRNKTVRQAALIAIFSWLFLLPFVFVILIPHWTLMHEPMRAMCVVTNLPRAFVYVCFCLGFVLPVFSLTTLNVLLIVELRRATFEKFRRKKTEIERRHSKESNILADTESTLQHHKNNTDDNEATIQGKATQMCKSLSPNDTRNEDDKSCNFMYEAIQRELKKVSTATRKLRIFVGVFCLNWFPFYGIILIDTIVPVPDWLVFGGALNAALNSFINPFMYALMNRRFQRRFWLMSMGIKRTLMEIFKC